ncbi:hypothetical protein [Chthonobacter albigriseus]|uniref:hypothetical protein n=1 Tax=Chthonobacter albigriseus TaxID=1683161 RepID=UPI0015EF83E7|nr:hypothetical protein [Chthonobacter albigriseus]
MIVFSSSFFDTRIGLHPRDADAIGKPLADWLRNMLVARGAEARGLAEPGGIGWTFEVEYDGREFLIGVHGVRKAGHPRTGEYSILVQLQNTFLEALTGGADASVDDPIIFEIEDLLASYARADNVAVLVDG